jgi:hypothetical protein
MHTGDSSSWESEVTWRPLPRRERHRNDYHVVQCRNRHTITSSGWIHEQHNQKLTLADDGGEKIIAHESGLNTYTRIDDAKVALAKEYWAEHAKAWARIRAAWDPILSQDRFTLHKKVDGERLSSIVDDALYEESELRALPNRLTAFVAE